MIYLGIDPGRHGAIAVLCDRRFVEVHDCPLSPQGDLNIASLGTLVRRLADQHAADGVAATIEHIQTFGQEGRKSLAMFLENFGAWQGALAACGVPIRRVRPEKWRVAMVGKGAAKSGSIRVASLIFPEAADAFVKHDGRAEATLIAEFGRQLDWARRMSRREVRRA